MGAISMRASTLVFCGLVALSTTACKKTSGTGAAKDDLALVPKETNIILMANVSRMRNTEMWRKMIDVRDSDAQSKKEYEDFVQRCQLDPFKQIDSVFLAFPQTAETAPGQPTDQKEFAAILRGTFNEQKLVECAKEQAKKDGRDLTAIDYNGKKLYTDTQKGEAYGTFLDNKTAVIGGKEWVKKVVDLAAGKGESAKKNTDLEALMKRVKTNEALWGAGLVPQSTRDQFKNDPRLSSASSMKDIFGSVDFASGVSAEINVDTGSEADAKDLAAKATSQLADVRKSPQFMMMGLAQYLDGIKIESKGPTFRVALSYNQQQVDDLINRVKGLLKSFGSAMGGGGMPTQGPPQ